jgi:hypothetical protein
MFSKKTYDSGNAIEISWHIDDVKSLDNTLTDEQAREVLARFDHHHEASMETMWDDLKFHIDLYREEQADGTRN